MIADKIVQLPSVAGRYDADFIQTADVFLNTLPLFSEQLNKLIDSINATETAMNTIAKKCEDIYSNALNVQYDVTKKHDEIMQYVIPESATYAPEVIDAKIRMNQVLTLTKSI